MPIVWDRDRVEVCVCTNVNDAVTQGWLTFDFILNFRKKYNIYVALPYEMFLFLKTCGNCDQLAPCKQGIN